MRTQIRPMVDADLEPILELSLLAWAPVFASFEALLGSRIFLQIYPDWPTNQRDAVAKMCGDRERMPVWVADVAGTVAGFVVYETDPVAAVGEVQMLAVHPDFQRRGIGAALNTLALQKLTELGMKLAVVGTGGDPGHAPARRSYEKAGYTALPAVRYYKDLTAADDD